MIRSGCALALLLAACSGGTEPRPPAYPGTLRPPSALGADVMMRQRLTARWGDGEETAFDAVLQKHGDTLILLGLGPHGGRAFVLEQRDGHVRFENFVDVDLPFPPRFILLDIQRVFFPQLSESVLPDGEHTGTVDGEVIREQWREGKLVSRSFQRADGEPAGLITVDYGAGMASGEQPPPIVFHNGWFGYSLSVETLSWSRL